MEKDLKEETVVCTATNVNMIDNTDDKMMGTGKFKKKCGSNEKKKKREDYHWWHSTITPGLASCSSILS